MVPLGLIVRALARHAGGVRGLAESFAAAEFAVAVPTKGDKPQGIGSSPRGGGDQVPRVVGIGLDKTLAFSNPAAWTAATTVLVVDHVLGLFASGEQRGGGRSQ
jgi:hypothetical protein